MDMNEGFVSSTWETEEDVDQDILTLSEYTQVSDVKDPSIPMTLIYYYAKEKKKLELEGLSEKEAKCYTLEKDVDENESRRTDKFSGKQAENEFDWDISEPREKPNSLVSLVSQLNLSPTTRFGEAQATEPITLQHVNDAEKKYTSEGKGQTFNWSPRTTTDVTQVTRTVSVKPVKNAKEIYDYTINVNREQENFHLTPRTRTGEPQDTKRVFRNNSYLQGNPKTPTKVRVVPAGMKLC